MRDVMREAKRRGVTIDLEGAGVKRVPLTEMSLG
jgi:hypothetical protein